MNDREDLDALAVWAEKMARSAGEIMREYFYSSQKGVEIKDDNSPVTVADKIINDLVIARVKKDFPQHGVLGEEGSEHSERKQLWVCDPIDGTKGFIMGIPTAMFSLAYVEDGQPLVAIMYEPLLDRMFAATKGKGASENGQAIHVSEQKTLKGARYTCSPSVRRAVREYKPFFELLLDEDVQIVSVAGEVFRGVLTASGRVDIHTFPGQNAHDVAAIKLIVEEAGGKVTDLRGNDQQYDRETYGAIVSNGHIHDEMVRVMSKFGPENYVGRP